MTKLKGMLTGLGLIEDETLHKTAAPPTPAPAQVKVTPAVLTGNADAAMVAKLKTLVLGASPVIGQFMQNVEIVRSQFPNDESASMKAALAFTRVDKSALIEELNRTVAAALLHAKKSTETDRQKTRETSAGSLDKDLAAVSADIKDMEGRVVELQQSIAAKKTTFTELQGKIQNVEADLRRQDDMVTASFTQVEQYIALLGQTFARL